MTAHAQSTRYHAFDALRGAAMLLVVVMHVAIPYAKRSPPVWPIRDPERSQGFDFLLLAGHHIVLQVFFLLAGFLGAQLYGREGVWRTAVHRLRRIAVPLALAALTILPALQAISVYALAAVHPPAAAPAPTFFGKSVSHDEAPAEAVVHHFASGEFVRFFVPAHLWFLWFLLLSFAVMLPIAWLADRLRDRGIGRYWDAIARRLFESRLRWLILAGLTWPLLLTMTSPVGPDTPYDWRPPLHILAYYFIFFLVGWTLYRHRQQLGRFVAGWPWALIVAQAVVLPLGIALLYLFTRPAKAGLAEGAAFQQTAMGLFALYSWLSVGGLLGLFLRFVSRERPSVRWLADSSYWCYLASLPPIVLFQYLVSGLHVPAGIKFLAVTAATMAVLLSTYRLAVRHTWIGRMLNGPRTRPFAASTELGATALVAAGPCPKPASTSNS